MSASVTAPTRVGVIGLNPRAERLILPGLAAAPRALLTAVCSRDPAKASAVARGFPGTRPFSFLTDLLASDAVDAVYVNTPLETHLEICAAAIRARRAVICEKPLTPTTRESADLAAAALRAGVPTAVNFQYRSTLAFRLTERFLRENGIGSPLHARFELLQGHNFLPAFPRASALLDSGCHLFDVMSALLPLAGGDPITHLLGAPAGPSDPDYGWSTLARTASGLVVPALFSRQALGWRNGLRWTLSGERAAFEVETDGPSLTARVATPDGDQPLGQWRDLPPPSDLVADDARFPAFHLDRLVGAIRGEEPFPTFADAVLTNRFAEALARSAREGRWVTV